MSANLRCIQRGKRVVARMLPAIASEGFALDRLDVFLAKGPQLSASERQDMAVDLGAVRAQLSTAGDSWAV